MAAFCTEQFDNFVAWVQLPAEIYLDSSVPDSGRPTKIHSEIQRGYLMKPTNTSNEPAWPFIRTSPATRNWCVPYHSMESGKTASETGWRLKESS